MANKRERQGRITVTVQDQQQREREAKLLQIEQQLLQLMESLTVDNCSKMSILLKEIIGMVPSQLEWQKHVALSKAVCWTLLDFGKAQVSEVLVHGKYPDLLFPLKKLRKKARDTKRQCLSTFNCSMDTHAAFETALWRYKVTKSFPTILFNLADEPTCNTIARIHNELSSDIRIVFDYAQNWTLDQFLNFTNIRQLVVEEIVEFCSSKCICNQLESELVKQDQYIKFIYDNLLKFPEAWYWTLLSEINCTNEMFNSEWFLRFHGMRTCAVQVKKMEHEDDGKTTFQSSSRELAMQLANYYTTLLKNQALLIPAYIMKHQNQFVFNEFLEAVTRKKSVSTQTCRDLSFTAPNIDSCSALSNVQHISTAERIPLEKPNNCTLHSASFQSQPALDEERDTVLDAMTNMFQTDYSDISTQHSVVVAQPTESALLASRKDKNTVSGSLTDITSQPACLTQSSCFNKPNDPRNSLEKTTANDQIQDQSKSLCSATMEPTSHRASFQSQPALDERRDTVLEAMTNMFLTDFSDISSQHSVAAAQTTETALLPSRKDTNTGLLTDITSQPACLTQSSGSPITCFQKPNDPRNSLEKTTANEQTQDQSKSLCVVVKVEAASQSNSDSNDSDVEILEEPSEQIHTIVDFENTQDLIACLQTPGHILTSQNEVNAGDTDSPLLQIKTHSTPVLSSQEINSSAMTSEEPASASQTQQPLLANENLQQSMASSVPATHKCNATEPVLELPREREIRTLSDQSTTSSEKRTAQTSPKRILPRHISPIPKKKRAQLDRTQVPRHIFQPLSFAQSTKAANTGTTKTVNLIVPENVLQKETESSENANSWDFETQPIICELSEKIPKRKSASELLASGNIFWNAVSDPTSFASTFRQMLKSGHFDFVNRSTELNFSVALVSKENEVVLTSDIFLALMNVVPAEQPLLIEIINSASRKFTYGGDLDRETDEALCFLLLSADPANGYSSDCRSKFIYKIHNFLNSRAEIINFCRQSRAAK